MRAIVHFSVGISGMLLVLTFVNLEYRREFLLTFLSGFWALVPDLGWLLLRIGPPRAAELWKALFNSALGHLFWFHPLLDGLEPVDRVVEMTGAFGLLAVSVTAYYLVNDWDQSLESRRGRNPR